MKSFKIALFTLLVASPLALEAVVYQKALLESLKQRFEKPLTPQEKIEAIQEALIYATNGTKDALEKAKLNLDNASQIIQEELNKYEQSGVYPE